MTATMSDCLALRHAKALSVIGKERIGSADVWHVLALLPSGAEFHYWLEDAVGFRVYRTKVRTGKGPEETIESEFDERVVEGLPVRTTLVKTGADGKVKSRVKMEVLKARLNVAVGPSEFSWGAMGLAVGDPVADERVGQTLGYWDGEKIEPEYDRAIERGGERRREAIGAARWSRIGMTAVIVGVLVAVALFARRLVRARGNYGH